MSSKKTILAIETSCDETGIAVMSKEDKTIKVLSQAVASQIDIHKMTGGVVPEVAAREHVSVIRPMIEDALKEAQISGPELDTIAVTVGPGLMPALSVGVTAARTLAYAWNKPLVPVHHIEGHVYSALLNTVSSSKYQVSSRAKQFPISRARSADDAHLQPATYNLPTNKAVFPALALIVSGGHTLLIKVTQHLKYQIIGSTRDDAAGEVFDKVARLLGLPYPGGPQISKLAEQGNPAVFAFPRPMLHSGDLDFSFSGLKTAVFYTLRDMPPENIEAKKADIAASFQQAVVDSLTAKVRAALQAANYKTVLLAGGVAANKLLRQQMLKTAQSADKALSIAPVSLCGDNAVMIGQVGLIAMEAGRQISWRQIEPVARPPLESFSKL